MATADPNITSVSDDDAADMSVSVGGPPVDPYRYTSISDDERTDEESSDVGEMNAYTGDAPDSILLAQRCQRPPQHYDGIGLNAVVDTVGRQFAESDAVPTHSCINIAVETTVTPPPPSPLPPPPPYDGDSTRASMSNCCGGQYGLLSSIFGGTNISKERVCILLILTIAIVLIVLLEKMAGVDIVDGKKLVQVLATGVLPIRQEQTTTTAASTTRLSSE